MRDCPTGADHRFVARRDQEPARGVGDFEGGRVSVSPDVVEHDQPTSRLQGGKRIAPGLNPGRRLLVGMIDASRRR